MFCCYVLLFLHAQTAQDVFQIIDSNCLSLFLLEHFPTICALFLVATIAQRDGVSQRRSSSPRVSRFMSDLHIREFDAPVAILTLMLSSVVEDLFLSDS